MVTEYFCYTDGSSKAGDAAPGGWGFYIRPPDGPPLEGHGNAINTLSKVMEYAAVAEALAALPADAKATVFSDNQSLIENCSKHLDGWRRSGWANVDPLILELVKRIDALIAATRLVVTWQWVRGHGGNVGNRRADELAAQGAREAQAVVKAAQQAAHTRGRRGRG
jgi:ribonuclease HI